jgi:hypothetical protein
MKYVMDTGVLSLFYASSISTFRAYIGPSRGVMDSMYGKADLLYIE